MFVGNYRSKKQSTPRRTLMKRNLTMFTLVLIRRLVTIRRSLTSRALSRSVEKTIQESRRSETTSGLMPRNRCIFTHVWHNMRRLHVLSSNTRLHADSAGQATPMQAADLRPRADTRPFSPQPHQPSSFGAPERRKRSPSLIS